MHLSESLYIAGLRTAKLLGKIQFSENFFVQYGGLGDAEAWGAIGVESPRAVNQLEPTVAPWC